MEHLQKINQLLGHTFQNTRKKSSDIFSNHEAIKIQLKENFRGTFEATTWPKKNRSKPPLKTILKITTMTLCIQTHSVTKVVCPGKYPQSFLFKKMKHENK